MKATHKQVFSVLSIAALGAFYALRGQSAPPEPRSAPTTNKTTSSSPADQPTPPAQNASQVVPAKVARAGVTALAPTPPARVKKEDNPDAPFDVAGETNEARVQREKERTELVQRWQSEAPDSAWASEGAGRIVKLLSSAGQPSRALQAIDCRQSLCRFELHSAGATQGEVLSLIQAARQLELETWIRPVRQQDGTWQMETFFPKQGYRLSGGGGRIGQLKQGPSSGDAEVREPSEEG